jgi:HPr kinase/phosphorylase
MDQTVTVKMVIDYFGYRQISGDESTLNRKIEVPDVNRPGLELTGYFEHTDRRRVVILGDKEIAFIEGMNTEQQMLVFDFLTNEVTPMILISRDHVCPEVLLSIARNKNFPIFTSYAPTSSLMVEMISYLEEKMTISISVHGVLLSIYGVGVLIEGDSGMGKSEIALELLKKGQILIADDRVDVARVHNKIIGQAPELLKDLLEIRGIGILNVVNMFGVTATMPISDIDLVISLEKWDDQKEYTRIGNEEKQHENFFGIDLMKLVLPVREGRSMATVIESAVIDHILMKRGINCPKEFEQRVYNYLKKQDEEQQK